MSSFDLNVNGRQQRVESWDPEQPLLYALRNDMRLHGAKFGCGEGQCGACTVLIDDQPARSCQVTLVAAAGKRITTIEGLGSPEKPHPVQAAFIAEQAAQCGYCTNGMVMSTVALLRATPRPSLDEAKAALHGNLCRGDESEHMNLTTRSSIPLLAACTLLLGACAHTGAPTLSKERIAEILASPDRRAADRTNDIRRKPHDMLAFIGLWPGMVALDLSAGGGYTTELVARSIGPSGRVYGQNRPRDPNSPAPKPAAVEGAAAPATPRPAGPPTPAVSVAERAKNPAASNIVPVVRRFEDPIPPEVAAGGLDLVTLMFNYHDLGWMGVDRAQMNRAVFAALKHGGMYVIADHSGRAGTGISESGTLHRVEEAFLRKEVEAAGFRLAEEGNFLRNPGDPRDKNTPDPPQPKDEFVLKFVKP